MERSEILNDLAAVFRWTAKLNMHEGIANHFSVCKPGSVGDFYVNGTGMHFSNIKASDLILIEDKKFEEMKKNLKLLILQQLTFMELFIKKFRTQNAYFMCTQNMLLHYHV